MLAWVVRHAVVFDAAHEFLSRSRGALSPMPLIAIVANYIGFYGEGHQWWLAYFEGKVVDADFVNYPLVQVLCQARCIYDRCPETLSSVILLGYDRCLAGRLIGKELHAEMTP